MGLKKCVACKMRFEWDNTAKCPNCGWDKQQWKNKWKDGVERAVQNPDSLDQGTPDSVNDLLNDLNEFDTHTLQSGFLIVLQDYIENNPSVLPDPVLTAFNKRLRPRHPFRQHQHDALEELDLPSGFSARQQPEEYDLSSLADDANQHEWLIYPGEEVLEMSVEGLASVICPVREKLTQASGKTNIPPETLELSIFQALLINEFTLAGTIIPAFIAVYLRKSHFDLAELCRDLG